MDNFKKETLALELELYIRDYVPNGWKESLEMAMFIPWVSVVDLTEILEGKIPDKFNHIRIKEAINAWLKTREKTKYA